MTVSQKKQSCPCDACWRRWALLLNISHLLLLIFTFSLTRRHCVCQSLNMQPCYLKIQHRIHKCKQPCTNKKKSHRVHRKLNKPKIETELECGPPPNYSLDLMPKIKHLTQTPETQIKTKIQQVN